MFIPRPQKQPLRKLEKEEIEHLKRLSRSQGAPAAQVARAKAILAVAAGQTYSQAARDSGQASGDTVASWVQRFNREGLSGIVPRHGGGAQQRYNPEDRAKIVEIARSIPNPQVDGTSNWTLHSLRTTLQRQGLPAPSIYTLWVILRDAGLDWHEAKDVRKSPHLSRSRSGRKHTNLNSATVRR
jgi:transposase